MTSEKFTYSNTQTITEQKIMFTKMLILFKLAAPLSVIIDTLTSETANQDLKYALMETSYSLRNGESLAEAFKKHHTTFSPVTLEIMHSSEASGDLPQGLSLIIENLKLDKKLYKATNS